MSKIEQTERAIDPATVILALKTAQAVATALVSVVDAIEMIQKGDPDKVDLAALKKQLLELPDLPTE